MVDNTSKSVIYHFLLYQSKQVSIMAEITITECHVLLHIEGLLQAR